MDKNYYALTFICKDKPGIVMEVSHILLENNFNIEDSSSTLLEGIFSMILIVSSNDIMTPLQIKKAFAPLVKNMGVSISVRKINKIKENNLNDESNTYIISIYGSDKPGIVYNITKVLAKKKINIIDLQTKITGDRNSPIYVMLLEVLLPLGSDDEWKDELYEISKQLGIDVNIRPLDSYEM